MSRNKHVSPVAAARWSRLTQFRENCLTWLLIWEGLLREGVAAAYLWKPNVHVHDFCMVGKPISEFFVVSPMTSCTTDLETWTCLSVRHLSVTIVFF